MATTFTSNSTLGAAGSITLQANSTAGGTLALPAATLVGGVASNYTVTVGGATNDPVTAASGAAALAAPTNAGNTDTITVQNPIPSGSVVTVTVTGATNPAAGSVVYLTDGMSSDAGVGASPQNTANVSIAFTSASAPTITGVNPQAYYVAGGEAFTISGTGFIVNSGTAPAVCFVAVGTTPPAGGSAANPCPAPVIASGTVVTAPAVLNGGGAPPAQTSTQLQGLSPALTAATKYNVVVYNFNAGSATPGYTAGSTVGVTNAVAAATSQAGALNVIPESGVRAVDSRNGTGIGAGALATGSPLTLPFSDFVNSVSSPTNVPAGATGLILNVTAVAPSGPGNIQLWSAAACTAASNPGTATVNFQSPQDTNNSTILGVTPGNPICVQDNGASVQMVIDVEGYTLGGSGYTAAPAGAGNPSRILDTRPASQTGGLIGPLAGGTVYRFAVPAAVAAPGTTVALNVADVAPTAVGNLRVFPEPASGPPTAAAVPNAAVDTYIPNTDGSALLIVTIPGGALPNAGYLDLYSDSAGTTNAVVDLVGTFGAASSLTAVGTPYRIADTRTSGGVASGSTTPVLAAPSGTGSNFVPGNGLGVIGNLADINPAGQGYMVAFPTGVATPGTASIANYPNQTRSTAAATSLNPANGSFSIYNLGASSNFTFDVTDFVS